MEVPFTSELETKVQRLAAESGRDAAQYVSELVANYVDHDRWFREEVRKGLDQLDRGESIAHDEVVARVERIFHP
jgi:predicted transcriptional regulator